MLTISHNQPMTPMNRMKPTNNISFGERVKQELSAERVFNIFEEITPVYRETGHCQDISQKLENRLKELDFSITHRKDAKGQNSLVACRGAGDNKIMLQAHMDIVAISDDGNPQKPIEIVKKGDFLKANARTLGADDGIGIAIGLAVAEDPRYKDLPLEIIFTTDEEKGLFGAKSLQPEDFKGHYLINLDSEEIGIVTIGCAGIDEFDVAKPIPVESAQGKDLAKINFSLSGATGGHSGVDIHKGRINPIKEVLSGLATSENIHISKIEGGQASNAIPKNVSMEILVPKNEANKKLAEIETLLETLKQEFEDEDPKLKFTTQLDAEPDLSKTLYMEPQFQQKFLKTFGEDVLTTLKSTFPNGDNKTSQNLGIMSLNNGMLKFNLLQRSSDVEEKESLKAETGEKLSTLFGETIPSKDHSPIWHPKFDSALTKMAVDSYKEMGIDDAKASVCHGGLENAIFAQLRPDIDQISVGPDIFDPHTSIEKVRISSVEKVVTFMEKLLAKLGPKVQ